MDKKTKFGMVALAVLLIVAGICSLVSAFTNKGFDHSNLSIVVAFLFIAGVTAFVFHKNKKDKKDDEQSKHS